MNPQVDGYAASRCRQAFTLLELLIVLVIMLTVAAMMTVGLGMIEDHRNRLLTTQRIENVLNTIARTGLAGSGSVTYELQSHVEGGIGGTRRFERGLGVDAVPYVLPEDSTGDGNPDPWHPVFPQAGAVAPDNPVVAAVGMGHPLIMAYPWGNQRRYRIGDWNNPSDLDYYYWQLYESQVSNDPEYAYPAAERHIIRELWPQRSAEILAFLNIASDPATYRSNRNPKQAWNDAWGQPLVISYALYQPPRYQGSDPRRYPDSYLQLARQEYQYNRSVFMSVGAPGPDISPYALIDDWQINLIAMWNHICDIAMPDDQQVWDERSFNINPWSGIHRMTDEEGRRTTFLSAPVEFR